MAPGVTSIRETSIQSEGGRKREGEGQLGINRERERVKERKRGRDRKMTDKETNSGRGTELTKAQE